MFAVNGHCSQSNVRLLFLPFEGLIPDPLALLNSRKYKNIWTEKEKKIFKEKYVSVVRVAMGDIINDELSGQVAMRVLCFHVCPHCRYVEYPKNFAMIKRFLENKVTFTQCNARS